MELPNLSNKELQPALSTLTIFLLSASSVVKFGALKIINRFISNPIRATLLGSTSEIEAIMSDNNRSLSSLAISILLKVCKDENVEKLLNQIYEVIFIHYHLLYIYFIIYHSYFIHYIMIIHLLSIFIFILFSCRHPCLSL